MFRMNVGKSNVMRCSRYIINVGLSDVIHDEPLKKYIKNDGSQVAADGGYARDVIHRINDRYKACRSSREKCDEH